MREKIKEICDNNALNHNFSGVCMVKENNKTIFEKAYGYANRSFKVSNKIDTRFDTASITKIFTATAIMQLIENKQLSLTNKITEIIDLRGTKIPKDVTIEHLLNHTSGIADDADEEAGEDYSALFINSPNYALKECSDFLKNFAYKDPNFKAGTNVRYCNCSYILLGLAIEKITKLSYRDYVTLNVFKKADMNNSGFFGMDEVNENIAEGYKNIVDEEDNIIGYKKNIYSYPPKGTPDGGAYTTAEDLNKFINSIINCKLLSKEYRDILLKPHCAFTHKDEWYEIPGLYEENGYAFEFFMIGNEKTPFCIYKDGCNDGVASMFSYYPEKNITLVLLSNQEADVWAMRKDIQVEIYKKLYE